MPSDEEIKDKISRGWIKSRMWFEVMASDKETAGKTLEDHISDMKKLKNTHILNKKFEETIAVKNPPKNFKQAFSRVAEVELLSKDIETMLFAVIYFGPSGVEILEPKELTVGIETIQAIMNSVADAMHRLASAGAGGIVVATKG